MHALSGCDTALYPYGKGRVAELNTMVHGNYHGSAPLGDAGVTHIRLMNAAIRALLCYTVSHQEHS